MCRQVFLKYHHVERLNVAVGEFARRVTTCQKFARRFVAQRQYAVMKQKAKKCEEDMRQMSNIVRQLTDDLKPRQKKLQDEDARNEEERRRAEQKSKEDEKRTAEEKKKKSEEKHKQQENNAVVC